MSCMRDVNIYNCMQSILTASSVNLGWELSIFVDVEMEAQTLLKYQLLLLIFILSVFYRLQLTLAIEVSTIRS